MNFSTVYLLVKPRLLSYRNMGRNMGIWSQIAVIVTVLITVIALFSLSWYLLLALDEIPLIATVLKSRLLNMTVFAFFWMMALSTVITSLGSLFAAEDLPLLLVAPHDIKEVFAAKFLESTLTAALISTVVFLASLAGFFASSGALVNFIPAVLLILPPFVLIASSLSTLLALLIGRWLSIKRARSLFQLLFILAAAGIVFFLRSLEPEKLFIQKGVSSIPFYLQKLHSPAGPWDPSNWMTEVLMSWLTFNSHSIWWPLFKLWGLMFLALFLVWYLAGRVYLEGTRRYRESAENLSDHQTVDKISWPEWLMPSLPLVSHTVIWKDLLIYVRTPVMLTQMLMLLAVAGIYVYNLVLLPIEPGVGFWRYLCALFGFLNMGMIGFVLAAAALRFVFPVLALEGKAFYLIRVSPLSTWRYLLTKLLSNSIVFIFFALLLTWLSMTLLVPGDKIFTLGLVNAIFLPIGIVAWNLGLGIFFPNTGLSSVTEAPASFGGFMTMMISVFYVVLVLGFQSVYVFERFWKWHVIGEAGYEFWWGTALVISAVVIITGWIIPMVLAAKKLENGDGIL